MRTARQIRIIGQAGNLRIRTTGDWETEPLDGLREACRLATALDKLIRQSVGDAREAGHSWTEIGQALGVAKQTAWERYSGED